MLKYLNSIGDVADIIEDVVDALQQLRYGNEREARIKLLKVATSATRLYNELDRNNLIAETEGE